MAEPRYIVSWIPTAAVEMSCRAAGRPDGDDTSFWDWIEPDDCRQERTFPFFRTALRFARSVTSGDVFGSPRIERQVLTHDHDDLGNVFASRSWERDAFWEVLPNEPVDQAAPDYRDAA